MSTLCPFYRDFGEKSGKKAELQHNLCLRFASELMAQSTVTRWPHHGTALRYAVLLEIGQNGRNLNENLEIDKNLRS